MENNYPKAYREVFEILKFLPKSSVEKIPNDILEAFELNMDKEYEFSIDTEKKFEEQQLLDETKAIFSNIFRDYWALPYQKSIIEERENYERQKIEQHRIATSNESLSLQCDYGETGLVVKKEHLYQRIIKFIKKLFNLDKEHVSE